jgi:hypothetical protein
MSCVLRASGVDFDVDAFLATCELEPIAVFRKGEPRFPTSQPEGPRNQGSAVNFEASGADFSKLELQMEEALEFVREHQDFITMLREFPGVEGVTLNFGAEIHPPGWRSFHFASELLLAFGTLGVSLELSVYPVEEEDAEPA